MAETIRSVYDDFQHFKVKFLALFLLPCKFLVLGNASPKIDVWRIRIERAYHMSLSRLVRFYKGIRNLVTYAR